MSKDKQQDFTLKEDAFFWLSHLFPLTKSERAKNRINRQVKNAFLLRKTFYLTSEDSSTRQDESNSLLT